MCKLQISLACSTSRSARLASDLFDDDDDGEDDDDDDAKTFPKRYLFLFILSDPGVSGTDLWVLMYLTPRGFADLTDEENSLIPSCQKDNLAIWQYNGCHQVAKIGIKQCKWYHQVTNIYD